jgi:hypothetical protein
MENTSDLNAEIERLYQINKDLVESVEILQGSIERLISRVEVLEKGRGI